MKFTLFANFTEQSTDVLPLGCCFANLDEVALTRLKLKFDICYVMAKQCLPFAKCPALLELESHHGADLLFS